MKKMANKSIHLTSNAYPNMGGCFDAVPFADEGYLHHGWQVISNVRGRRPSSMEK